MRSIAVSDARPTVVVRVRPGTRAGEIQRWIRWMLPTALLVVTQAPLAIPPDAVDVISIEADDVESGPLSLADALARRMRR